jgi:Carbohydrate-binding family 9
MKIAEVKKLESKSLYPDLEEVSVILDKQSEKIHIDTLNWEEFNYKPDVKLSIAYSDLEIFIKYYVTENYFKAEKTETNQMVCEDSCVEFFVSPEDDGIYYNMEFNGIGTCLLGTGTGREDSKKANPVVVSKIRRLTSSGTKPIKENEGEYTWTITVAIPFEVFFHHKIEDLKGLTFRANFYKCGDMLKVPHFVTWNPVGTQNPDYHQPVYFGLLKFV